MAILSESPMNSAVLGNKNDGVAFAGQSRDNPVYFRPGVYVNAVRLPPEAHSAQAVSVRTAEMAGMFSLR